MKATIPLKFDGRPVSLAFEDTGNMRHHIAEILAGKTYPLPPLPPGYSIDTVVDIGANIGAAAIWLLSVAPAARLVCFEPDNENFEKLKSNLSPFPRAEVFHCGLSDENTEAELFVGANQSMQHSLVKSAETTSRTKKVTIKRASDEFHRLNLDAVSILKLDTEGCEVPILTDLGNRCDAIDMIFVEYHSEDDRHEIDRLLAKRFLLSGAQATYAHRGVMTYLARDIAERVPVIANMPIRRAASQKPKAG